MSMGGGSSQQQATASGDGSVVSQVDGSNNVVTIFARGSQMVLDRPHKRRREPTNELELLLAEFRATRFVGRSADMQALQKWRDQEAPIAVRCLIGRGGSGKSRLAIEACEAAEEAGWIAGFVDGDELRRFHGQMNLGASQPEKPTLIVVDDAASAGPILKGWFTALARQGRDPGAGKLRVLMLERQAEADFGWWAELKRVEDLARAGAYSIIDQEQPVSLSVLAAETDRRALLQDTMALAAQLPHFKGLAVPALPVPGADAQFDALLANDSRLENEPLFLMMAAIVGLQRGAASALALGKPELAAYQASTERERLVRLAEARGLDGSKDLLLHAAACITLQRGCSASALMTMLKEESAAMELGQPSAAVAKLLREAMPERGEMVDGIRPDLIGGAFMVEILKGEWPRGPEDSQAIVARAKGRAGLPVVETLVRAVQDLAEGSADFPAVQWLLSIARGETNADKLADIIDALPQESLALREAAEELQQALTLLRRQDGQPAALAASLTDLTKRLSDLGRHKGAVSVAEEAVTLYRQLEAEKPNVFLPGLVGALHNLAICLGDIGRLDEALAAADEAVILRRQLATALPVRFLPDLASSLNSLAVRQSAVERWEEALASAEEAVLLYRRLAEAQPDTFLSGLAGALNTLANRLNDVGRREQALATANEAVVHYRELAAAHPDAFLPDLATSLLNLATCFRNCRQMTEAQAIAAEAVELQRRLADGRPAAFRPSLASALNNLAAMQNESGRQLDALRNGEEAVALRRELAAELPDAFIPDLAMSLNNLSNFQSELDLRREALETAEESLLLYRKLISAGSYAHLPDLARSLNTLANRLGAVERGEEALSAAEEAVRCYRQLASVLPDAFEADLAMSLHNFANRMSDLGRHTEGVTNAEEAVERYWQLANVSPGQHLPDLARALAGLADKLEKAGRLTESCERDSDAVLALSLPFLKSPSAHAGLMSMVFSNYCRRHEAAGRAYDLDLIGPIVEQLNRMAEEEE